MYIARMLLRLRSWQSSFISRQLSSSPCVAPVTHPRHVDIRAFQMDDTHVVDMRSDTNTVPSPAMYDAMRAAPVGNDVFGEDPTVNELERRCSEMLGKEAGLFVPTGTMGNLLAIMVHCERIGCEFMVGDMSHIYLNEQGGSAQFAHAHAQPLKNLPDGTFSIDDMREGIRDASDYHHPETTLVCVENTHNACGGKVIPLDFLQQVHTIAHENGLAVHMDGARIWNSAAAQGIELKDFTQYCDSINVCFSKGLGCPVGSLVAGTHKFVERCRRSRKALGGGMRQAGVLAGAVIWALEHVYPQLHLDHQRAKQLAKGLAAGQHEPLTLDLDDVQSNMVKVEVSREWDVNDICRRLKQVTKEEEASLGNRTSVVVDPCSSTAIRFVTYIGITDHDVERTITKCDYVFTELFSK